MGPGTKSSRRGAIILPTWCSISFASHFYFVVSYFYLMYYSRYELYLTHLILFVSAILSVSYTSIPKRIDLLILFKFCKKATRVRIAILNFSKMSSNSSLFGADPIREMRVLGDRIVHKDS